MVNSTVLQVGIDSERKQPEVARKTYELLKAFAQASNNTGSKGIIAYEILQMARSEGEALDAVDEYEQFVDEQLSLSTGTDFCENVEKIKLLRDLEGMEGGNMEVFDSYFREMGNGSASQLSVYLPPKMCEIYSYGLNRVLDRAVEDYMESPFDDRTDRIECKREILEWIESGTNPSHSVARDVVRGESDWIDIVDVHEELMNEVTDWWQRDDLTWDIINNKQQGTQYLSKHKRDERIEAVYNAWQNEPKSQEMTKKKIEKLYNIKPGTGTSDTYMRLLYERYQPDYDGVNEEIDFDRFGDDIYMGKIPLMQDAVKAEQAYLLNEAFKTYAAEKDRESIPIEMVRKVMVVGQWIPEEFDAEATGKYINGLKTEYGIDFIKKGSPTHIFFNV